MAEFKMEGAIGTADRFVRSEPAELEGPPEAWQLARVVVDHGCFVLMTVNEIRGTRPTSDAVTAALLRRAVITTEAVRCLLAAGLLEAAYATFRTLLDIECNMRLVTSDGTEQTARKLAAFHYLKGQRHFTGQLKSPSMRSVIEGHSEHHAWTLRTSRKLKGLFESFDDIKDEVASGQHWHGFANMGEAFDAAGLGNDYLSLYGLWSPFVHAGNPEHDFDEIIDDKPHLRALVERDPQRTLGALLGALVKLLDIIEVFLDHRDDPEYQPELHIGGVDNDLETTVPPVTALRIKVLETFGDFLPDEPSLNDDEASG